MEELKKIVVFYEELPHQSIMMMIDLNGKTGSKKASREEVKGTKGLTL